jgi:hypothetical protein
MEIYMRGGSTRPVVKQQMLPTKLTMSPNCRKYSE